MEEGCVYKDDVVQAFIDLLFYSFAYAYTISILSLVQYFGMRHGEA